MRLALFAWRKCCQILSSPLTEWGESEELLNRVSANKIQLSEKGEVDWQSTLISQNIMSTSAEYILYFIYIYVLPEELLRHGWAMSLQDP